MDLEDTTNMAKRTPFPVMKNHQKLVSDAKVCKNIYNLIFQHKKKNVSNHNNNYTIVS